ncbi:terpene synthase 10-like [Zingiber officinale]|uniref:terpene synthase 10-like n=1 Tax=Zingiber officinale TaxID=94328 RepID=UPI001C4C9E56|nr:terpene synthase 10-like [Zingiber officinale]
MRRSYASIGLQQPFIKYEFGMEIKASATFGSRDGLGGFSRPAAAIKQWRCLPLTQCHVAEQSQCPSTTLRRSGNYQPSIWTHERIQSLTLSHTADEDDHAERIKLLKNQTSKLMEEKKGQLEEQLQLIDHLQQLGVAYHFKDEIKDTLRGFHASFGDIGSQLKDNLHASALLFRLLRENGFSVSQDIFKKFKDEKGQFEDRLRSQTQGLLSLYEASYLEKDGEELLHEAREFTTKHLKNLLEEEGYLKPGLIREQVAHALELPLNWRFQRLHTKWFIGAWQRDPTMDPALLLLAKLDFNALQNIYKRELRDVSRWWTDLGLPQKLPFFRDRLTENYLWTVGWAMEPDCWAFRELQTKTNCFITMIDDVYDVYGTLHELELFTDIMERWDVNAIDKLPEYMKICFLAVFNSVNDAGYEVTRDKGVDIIPYLKRAWAELCKIYMREARWYHAGHTPTLDEYLDGAWISISGALILSTAYCMGKDLTKEDLDKFSTYPSIVQPSCMLLRLHDDFGTSTDELARGDVQKAVQCCMHERKVPEAVAREHIKQVMEAKWRLLNGNRVATSSFEEYFQNVAINVPRAAQFFYGKGDGYAKSDGETQKQVMSLLIEPVQ